MSDEDIEDKDIDFDISEGENDEIESNSEEVDQEESELIKAHGLLNDHLLKLENKLDQKKKISLVELSKIVALKLKIAAEENNHISKISNNLKELIVLLFNDASKIPTVDERSAAYKNLIDEIVTKTNEEISKNEEQDE